MVSHSKRFVFVHIPRTGGTLVEAGLGDHGEVLEGKDHFDSLYFKHASARRIRHLMGSEFDTYFRFSLVRNPWDWAVSNYTYNRGLHYCYVAGTKYEEMRTPGRIPSWAEPLTFDHWLRWWLDEFNPSQHGLLAGDDGRSLVDTIYHFETLDRDVRLLCDRLGVTFAPRDVDTRSPSRRPYPDYYTDETRRLVGERLREDIDRFGYSE